MKTQPSVSSQHLLSLLDYSAEQIQQLLSLAATIKAQPEKYSNALQGKSIVTLYEKPSLRTRVTFDIGIAKLGGHSVYLEIQGGTFGERETVADVARNMSCWADALVARVFYQKDLDTLAEAGSIPIVNALSDMFHPCQALADMLTLQENLGELAGKKLAYVGDGNNVCHSLMIAAAKLGMNMTVVTPEGYQPDPDILDVVMTIASASGAVINVSIDVADVQGSDAVYTDTWLSMGDETPFEDLKTTFESYQVNSALMAESGASLFLHCQPAHRGVEVTSDVFDGETSVVLQQAENRMYVQNAVLVTLLGVTSHD